jgi:stage V sporulation protein G
MEITEIKVFPANEGRLKGYASMVIDGCLIIRNMKIIKSDKGEKEFFISMPSQRKKDGSFKDIVHPLNAETRELIEDKIVAEYRKVAAASPEMMHNDEE